MRAGTGGRLTRQAPGLPRTAPRTGEGAPTWQLPRVGQDGDRDEEGGGPGAQEAHPPGADPQRALGGQLGPAGGDGGVSVPGPRRPGGGRGEGGARPHLPPAPPRTHTFRTPTKAPRRRRRRLRRGTRHLAGRRAVCRESGRVAHRARPGLRRRQATTWRVMPGGWGPLQSPSRSGPASFLRPPPLPVSLSVSPSLHVGLSHLLPVSRSCSNVHTLAARAKHAGKPEKRTLT